MRKLYTLIAIVTSFQFSSTNAQNVGINDDASTPHASAILDVKSINKGLLIPRVALTATNLAAPISSPGTSLLVYNTVATSGEFGVSPGFYFWNGSGWEKISSNTWSLNGNAWTDPSINFIGTKDDQPLVFKVNNVYSGFINRTHGNTGFGFSTLLPNSSGTANTAVGAGALVANTLGSANSASGYGALLANTTGASNTANGNQALYSNIQGSYNTAVGDRALQSNTVGSNNTAIGYLANVGYGNQTNSTAIGYNALVTQSNSMVLGNNVNVGVGTSSPDMSALLDLSSNSRGVLIPRMTSTERAGISSPATGLIVYQADGTQGIYVNLGTPSVPNWTSLSSTNNVWTLNGNAGTTSASFVGTTDMQPLSFKVSNFAAGFIHPSNENTAFGLGTLVANTTGNLNTANGAEALYSNTTGSENIAVGVAALQANTTGSLNTATGNQALLSNTEGVYNAAHGYQALHSNTTGTYNTAIGSAALFSNTEGMHNTALGSFADVTAPNLVNATAVGYNSKVSQSNSMVLGENVNVGIGTSAPNSSSLLDLTSNSKGLLIPRMTTDERNGIASPATGLLVYDNLLNSFYYHNGTAWAPLGGGVSSSGWLLNGNSGTDPATQFIGTTDTQPLLFKVNNVPAGQIQVSNANTAFGVGTLANSTGDQNTAVGYHALYSNTTGQLNTAHGSTALFSNTTGSYNTAIGLEALHENTTGNANSAFGEGALYLNSTGGGNTAVGESTLNYNTTGNYNTAVGSTAMYQSSTGSYNSAVGVTALMLNTSGSYNTAVGFDALRDNGATDYNTGIGYSALRNNNTGAANTASGYNALRSNTSGSSNTANGYEALYSNTTGFQNLAMGYQALHSNTSGFDNTANGQSALFSNTTGRLNTGTGYFSLHDNNTGIFNTAHGSGSLGANTTGSYNVASGSSSLIQNITGSHNTASGFESLYSNNEDFNTAFGSSALRNTTISQGNTALGYMAGAARNNGYYNVFLGANTDVNGDDYYNCIAIGHGTVCTAVSQVTIGNSATTSYRAYANWSNISDGRYKQNVREDVPGLSFITKLKPVTYNLDAAGIDNFLHRNVQNKQDVNESFSGSVSKEKALNQKGKIRYTGFVAQDVERAAQELGFDFSGVDAPKNANDVYSLRYSDFVVPLVKAVQEQQALIEKQNDEIKKLRDQLDALARTVQALSSNK
jgi:trimeric autotransporter adhesin